VEDATDGAPAGGKSASCTISVNPLSCDLLKIQFSPTLTASLLTCLYNIFLKDHLCKYSHTTNSFEQCIFNKNTFLKLSKENPLHVCVQAARRMALFELNINCFIEK
jgi:hypothetical protein